MCALPHACPSFLWGGGDFYVYLTWVQVGYSKTLILVYLTWVQVGYSKKLILVYLTWVQGGYPKTLKFEKYICVP